MIARVWHGVTAEADADRYAEYLAETGVKECSATPGNRGVLVERRVADGRAEFVFTSFWDSMEVIRGFAGEDVERAVYYPRDHDFLLEMEPCVRHYEVVSGGLPDREDG